MNEQPRTGHLTSVVQTVDERGVDLAADLLRCLFKNVADTVSLRLWNGVQILVGRGGASLGEPRYTLVFRNPQVVCSLVLDRDPLGIADAYFRGDIDVEGDFRAALGLRNRLQDIRLSLGDRLGAWIAAMRLQALVKKLTSHAQEDAAGDGRSLQRPGIVKRHSKLENRNAVSFHYDISNEFYALWLDRALVYSCAYFESPDVDLDSAQEAKLEHICRKLVLRPNDRLLDIGCGWGALLIHAATHHGVLAHGVTLSVRQLELAQQRIAAAGLGGRITVELRDYRDLEGVATYDKIASVGMFEHVGLRNLPTYFATIHRLLKPSGLFLNHGITQDSRGWEKSLCTEFINRYVFPDGQLDTVSRMQVAMEEAQFEIEDVEALRAHYAITLERWVNRLERHHEQALRYVNEATYRVWRLYMSACALDFRSGEIGVYQVLAGKRANEAAALPLTRRHVYQ
jgi:cyclopropane-fatty-acyl-phospholipid synthase